MIKYFCYLATALLLFSCSNPKAKEAPEQDNEVIVRTVVSEMQSSLPQKLGNGFVLAKMYLKSNHVVYEYEIDENINNMAGTAANEARMKEEILASMRKMPEADQKSFKEFLQAIRLTGRDLVYLYVGNKTHTEWRIVFSKEELEKM
ncbi:MAG: hypothetical protein IJJ68_08325 [Prevotella sp.]|nr:hypothetical protein [Prevotella sp.]